MHLLNIDALADYLFTHPPRSLLLVCAGTGEEFSLEDAVAAGALVTRLSDDEDYRTRRSSHEASTNRSATIFTNGSDKPKTAGLYGRSAKTRTSPGVRGSRSSTWSVNSMEGKLLVRKTDGWGIIASAGGDVPAYRCDRGGNCIGITPIRRYVSQPSGIFFANHLSCKSSRTTLGRFVDVG